MKQQTSSLSLAIRQGISGVNNAIRAKLASYLAAAPSRTNPQATRINSNPNATWSQFQRVQMSWDGENIVKNSDFGANYVQKRRMYCTNEATYAPDTGDEKLNEDLRAYLDLTFAKMGVNCSMLEAFSRTADVEQPMRGDSALIWVRDENRMRLMEVQSDRIGEIYQYYSNPEVVDGLNYYAGIYTYPTNSSQFGGEYAAFKVYERIDQWYGNAAIYPSTDVLFFKDDLMASIRGVTKFAQCLPIIGNREMILNATMQTMLQQSKIAAIASNNSGEPDFGTYDTQVNNNGTIEYVERNSDGPIVKWQFNGDSYQVLKSEHPSTSFQLAIDRLDEKACLAIGFPYSFLFSSRDTGGAPSRFEFGIASKEIQRLRKNVYRPRLDIISYVTIMDAIERKIFRPKIAQNSSTGRWENVLTRGTWNFGTLPTADAFRDDKSDVMSVRAGTQTRNDVTTANSGRPFSVVLRQSTQEAIAIAKATQDANKALKAAGYEETITRDDIAQISDNPQQAANAQAIDMNGKTIGDGTPKPVAKLSAAIENGVWRTIRGRKIFIKDGQSLDDALKEGGIKQEGRKMHMASRGDYDTLPKTPFYVASSEDYARNYGDNMHEVHVDPENTLDLTSIDAEAEDGAMQLKDVLSKKGVDISGIKFGEEDELAQSLNRNLKSLSKRIQDAGYDSVSLNEYVYGGGKDETMLVLSDSVISGHSRKRN